MFKNLLVLPDGTKIFSGSGTVNAIQSTTLTSCVNSGTELTLGSVCSDALEVKIFTPNGELEITAGAEVTYYKVDETGEWHKIGLFTAEKPTRPSAHTYRLTAYDRVCWLDKDLTEWLGELDGWPYSLLTFAQMVCNECGLTLITESIPNGDYQVKSFTANATGRQLMQWIGEVCGRFCKANADGNIELTWYKVSGQLITTSGEKHYKQGALTYEDYRVEGIQKVQVRSQENDVGVVWPDSSEALNTYVITGNYLLLGRTSEELLPVVQNLYAILSVVRYTPCKVVIPANLEINAGDIVEIIDRNDVTITTYVMTKTQSGQRDTLESTGSASRDSSTAVNSESYKDLKGKVLTISKTVEGLTTRAENLEANFSQIEQTAGYVSVSVGTEKGTLTTIIDPTNWKAELVDINEKIISGLYFDFETGQFVFDGSGHFTGSINVADKFIVDIFGNASIFGGKFYAMDEDGNISGFTTMDKDGLTVYSKDTIPVIKIGFPTGSLYPYVRLNSGENAEEQAGIIKKFANGLWIGNDAPADAVGEFVAQSGYNGMFVSFADGKTYVVSGTDMQNVYTGEAIARFG